LRAWFDIPIITAVNFELPNIPEDYVHRIGRTGRAGANGEGFYLAQTKLLLRDIEKLIGMKLPIENRFCQIPKHQLNLLSKDKAGNNAIQRQRNQKQNLQTEAVIIALVPRRPILIMTDELPTKK
jgi:superfamily II DNA/RNA helicase